jgi:hypothetical protein
MEELTYFEALNYVQSQMPISKDGVQMTEEKINDLFLFVNEDDTIEFKVN